MSIVRDPPRRKPLRKWPGTPGSLSLPLGELGRKAENDNGRRGRKGQYRH